MDAASFAEVILNYPLSSVMTLPEGGKHALSQGQNK